MSLSRALAAFLVSFFLAALPAVAQQEAKIKQAVEKKLGFPVTSVTKAGYLGLYEVFAGGRILYTDENMTAFLAGNLIEANTMTSVTDQRMEALTRIRFADLPLKQAIKQVRGNGKRLLATFEDPNCGYCKRLNKDIATLKDVTIYTFLLPILGDDSLQKSKRIWCAKDQVKVWNDWMIRGQNPGGGANCDLKALEENVAFGQRLGINGTPTLFFADGSRAPGALPLAEIEKKMNNLTR
ncbi:MAG: DsbC family protein [Zoogloeaceae bacterium]|jgi:thiol:disulfide interchange protein DsbC|nr:DsbC family protein [Zoogloeaceae bacterium]